MEEATIPVEGTSEIVVVFPSKLEQWSIWDSSE
jgi:hypothetical protein